MSLYDATAVNPIVISFDSKDRVSGTNTNFISAPVDLGINKYDSVALVSVSVPKSFYNVPTSYNAFVVSEISSRTITIPVGNYTKNNLITTLATLLNSGAPSGWVYVVSYPGSTTADTLKITFGVSGNGAVQPTFIFTPTFSVFRQLGFAEGSSNNFVANTLTSKNAINLQYILRAFIKSNICKNAQDGILEELLNIGSFPTGSVMYYQQFNFDMNTRAFNGDLVNSWNFSLVDGYDQLIELNGISWAFSLVFYQRNNTHELHKNDLKIKNEERLFAIENATRTIQREIETGQNFHTNINNGISLSSNVDLSGIDIKLPQPIYPVQAFTQGLYKNKDQSIPEINYPEK